MTTDIEAVNAASFDFPLDADSVVVELGGYQGRWSAEISRRYGPRLYTFEPQDWAQRLCAEALKPYPQAHVYPVALGVTEGAFAMGRFGTDGCSFLEPDDGQAERSQGHMVEIGGAWQSLKLSRIDLLLVNIEGYEFVLLPYLVERGLLARVRRLMVQFHLKFDPGGAQYAALRARIEQDYRILFDYGSTLVAWERIGG